MDKFTYQKALWRQPAFKGHAAARVVLQIIIDHADGTTMASARPTMRTIAEEGCLSLGAVRDAIPYLIDHGFLAIDKQGTARTPNHYRLTLPRVSFSDTGSTEARVSPSDTQRVTQRHASVSPDDTDQVLNQDQIMHASAHPPMRVIDGAMHAAEQDNYKPDWAPDNWHELGRTQQMRLYRQRASA